MILSRLTVELAYMYYNPKTDKNSITLRPIKNTIHAATTDISQFLDPFIRPLFDIHAQSRPIIDDGHLLRQLEQYVRNGHLKSTTLFCTADITNLYTMLPYDESLEILEEFLREHHYEKNGILSIFVHYKPAAEPCVVPFISDHPRHVFSNIIRVVRYSSILGIFEKERRSIQLMLLYNGYSSKIDTRFRQLFSNLISQSSVIPFIYNENQLLIMRNNLLPKLSIKERATHHRITDVRLNEETNNHNTE
ncbi:unnamed protein product [Rotaria magnacalcarata]